MNYHRGLAIALIFIFTSACATGPVFYDNDKFKNTSKADRDKDVEDCKQAADRALEGTKGKQVANSAGRGAAVGAAVGGVLGLLTGGGVRRAARGAIGGGVVGGAAGAAGEAASPNQLKQRYTIRCLQDKNYEVIGWE